MARAVRDLAGWSVAELARLLRVSPRTIKRHRAATRESGREVGLVVDDFRRWVEAEDGSHPG